MYSKNTKRFMLIFNIWTDRSFQEEKQEFDTEKECREALKILSTQPDESFCNGSICGVSDCGYCPKNTASKLLKHLIDDHFANPALKLDEL